MHRRKIVGEKGKKTWIVYAQWAMTTETHSVCSFNRRIIYKNAHLYQPHLIYLFKPSKTTTTTPLNRRRRKKLYEFTIWKQQRWTRMVKILLCDSLFFSFQLPLMMCEIFVSYHFMSFLLLQNSIPNKWCVVANANQNSLACKELNVVVAVFLSSFYYFVEETSWQRKKTTNVCRCILHYIWCFNTVSI